MGTASLVAPLPSCLSPWIHSRNWDLTWLVGSALIVPVVLVFVWAGISSDAINLGVTCLIGGPHLFATYTATYMDSRFRRSQWWVLIATSILMPAFVIYWTIVDFQILLSVFIFAASVHVLHQNAYLTDIYRKKFGRRESMWSRLLDYGVLMLSIYPIAAYKLVHSKFMLGDIQILIPPFLRLPITYWLVWIGFVLSLTLWGVKSFLEYRTGVLNYPKTLLIGATTAIAFSVPAAAAGERLELAFQSVNAWHSIQYLGLVWYLQKVRKELGLIESPLIARISGPGRAAWYFYGFCFLITLLLFAALISLYRFDALGALGLKFSFKQYYYMSVLSCLLIHYGLDAYLFTVSNRQGVTPDRIPYAAAAAC